MKFYSATNFKRKFVNTKLSYFFFVKKIEVAVVV